MRGHQKVARTKSKARPHSGSLLHLQSGAGVVAGSIGPLPSHWVVWSYTICIAGLNARTTQFIVWHVLLCFAFAKYRLLPPQSRIFLFLVSPLGWLHVQHSYLPLSVHVCVGVCAVCCSFYFWPPFWLWPVLICCSSCLSCGPLWFAAGLFSIARSVFFFFFCHFFVIFSVLFFAFIYIYRAYLWPHVCMLAEQNCFWNWKIAIQAELWGQL